MPADYLSRLLSTNSDQLAEVTQCFDPFQPELIDLQKADPDLQRWTTLEQKVNGLPMSQKPMAIIYKIWWSNFSKMPTKLSESGSMTINILERHCTFLKNSEKWHFARLTIINLVVTMPPWRHTSASLRPTTGQEFILTFFDTQKPVSAVNNKNLPQTSHRHYNRCQRPTNPTSASTRTSLAPCWLQDVSTNTFCASQMPSQNTHLSQQSKIKKRKLWQKPFFGMVL
jgi:hypothetical protein